MNTYEVALKILEIVKDKPAETRQEIIDLYIKILDRVNYPDKKNNQMR